MRIKLSHYRHGINQVNYLLKTNKHLELGAILSIISVATSIPVIVVAYYIGESQGFTPELNKKIENLKKFYNYTKIEE